MRFSACSLPLLLVLALPSCLELDAVVVLRPDGSGQQTVRLGMNEQGVAIVRSMARERSAVPGIDNVFDPAPVRREIEAAGLEDVAVRTFEERQRRYLEIQATFDGVATLRRSPLLGGAAEWRFERGPRPGVARLVLYPRGEAAWREGWDRARRLAEGIGAREQSFFARARRQAEGLEVSWTLELPGEVVAHSRNLVREAPRRVTAAVRAEQLTTPGALVRLLAPRYEVMFDARECTFALDPPASVADGG
ncbi:MAG: hypothetical protein AAF628_25925 [Planctomycetota bacterium]